MKKFFIYFLLAFSLNISSSFAAEPNAAEILKLSDEVRFPRESFQVDVDILSVGDNADERKYRVISKGNENSIVATIEPASDYGQNILMKGRDIWIFMPEVSQPIRLSASQRLTGQVANGDIARANFSGDYNPTITGTEVIDGVAHYIMELSAVDKSVTYHRVVYWVNSTNNHPYKAEFYTVSGRLMKTCNYLEFKTILGKKRPTKLVMTDAVKKGSSSTLIYTDMKLRDTPDKLFTKEYLRKLMEQ